MTNEPSSEQSVLQALIDKNPALAEELLKNASDLELKDPHGNVALHYAAAYGYLDIIKGILEKGCPVAPSNEQEQTPLVYAMQYGQPDAAKLLWQHYGYLHMIGQEARAKDDLTRFACYVVELCDIGIKWTLQPGEASSGFYMKDSPLEHNHHPRARQIGEELHAWEGITQMKKAHSAVNTILGDDAARDLSGCWHKVGWGETKTEFDQANCWIH